MSRRKLMALVIRPIHRTRCASVSDETESSHRMQDSQEEFRPIWGNRNGNFEFTAQAA
jgi:hypothetical protein